MAHNNLRRAIEQERLASYEHPVDKIIALTSLLGRALSALGGPVVDNRPQGVTVGEGLPMQGRDTGDETEYAAGLGTRHNDVNGNLVP